MKLTPTSNSKSSSPAPSGLEVGGTCTEGQFTYNPFDWAARDSEGRTHEPEHSSGFDDARLDSGVLANESIARGVVIFDVPDGALTPEYTLGFEAPAISDIPA